MGLMQVVGGSGSRKSQRIADLLAKHGIFSMSCQYMRAEGKERRGSMCRDNWTENMLIKSAAA